MHQLRPFGRYLSRERHLPNELACSATAHSRYVRVTPHLDVDLYESPHPTVMLEFLLNSVSVSVMRRIVWGNAHSSATLNPLSGGSLVSRAQVYIRIDSLR